MSHDVRVITQVRVPPAVAFRVFTDEIDQWWGRGPKYRTFGGVLRFEGRGVGARLVEVADDGAVFATGEVTAWEAGSRLVFRWRLLNFAADESTEVEVVFEPAGAGTRVTLVHRGLSALRPDHPVFHGAARREALAGYAAWWGDVLRGFRAAIPG
jgi:uncharacterized protein YndB with AHSA1/START domain